MNPADVNTDFSQWILRQCRAFYSGQVNDGKSVVDISDLFPRLIDRMKELSGQANQELANDDQMQRAAIPQPLQDTDGLYNNASVEDLSAIWRLGQNSFDQKYASKAFDFLVTSFAKNQRLDYPEADRRVRSQFKALAALNDAQRCAEKLGVELPPTSTPGNPQWSSKAGLSVAPVEQKSLSTGYYNKTRTGLNAFAATSAIGNSIV